MDYLEASALISPCGLYRYTLTRVWKPGLAPCVFVMLNPSTADGAQDDPTIRRCVAFAKSWGYGRLVVVNLFAFRATDPSDLRKATDPVGPDNDYHIASQTSGRNVIAAWGGGIGIKGRGPRWVDRARAVRALIGSTALVEHLGLTKDGHPKHPLYLPSGTVPQLFPGQVA